MSLEFNDKRPVTTDALEAIGWPVPDPNDALPTWISPMSMRGGPTVRIEYTPDLGCDGWALSGELIPPLETMGQVYALCFAIGVPTP